MSPPPGPALPRREIRRTLERAQRLGRVVELWSLAGEHCAIAPDLGGGRVRGTCTEGGGRVDWPLESIHTVVLAVHGRSR